MDDYSYELLQLYASRETLSLDGLSAIYDTNPMSCAKPVKYLMDLNYLQINPTYASLHGTDFTMHSPIEITHQGRITLELETKKRKASKLQNIRNWLAIAISIIALIISAISLLLQII